MFFVIKPCIFPVVIVFAQAFHKQYSVKILCSYQFKGYGDFSENACTALYLCLFARYLKRAYMKILPIFKVLSYEFQRNA